MRCMPFWGANRLYIQVLTEGKRIQAKAQCSSSSYQINIQSSGRTYAFWSPANKNGSVLSRFLLDQFIKCF